MALPQNDSDALAVRYMPLAEGMAARFRRPGCPLGLDELQGVALLALVESARKYDPGRGVQFPAFARPAIRGALIDAVKREAAASGATVAAVPGDQPVERPSREPDPADAATLTDAVEYVRANLRAPRHPAADDGLTCDSIARRLGVSERAATGRRNRARACLAEIDADTVERMKEKASCN
ncbi:MAG: sigD 3 [Phycisphaerales bacterium]|nr:sigD 3 [Phycisphaerales bacterium]